MSLLAGIKSLGVVLPLGGWLLLALGSPWGWAAALSGSAVWIYLGRRMGESSITLLNGGFMVIQAVGCVRFLMQS